MEFAEQTISSAKLEKLRLDAVKKTKISQRIFPLCLILFSVFAVLCNWPLFLFVSEYGWGDPATKGALFRLFGSLMMAVILASGARIFYSMLTWQEAYDLFNFSYKNKYVLETLKKRPGFSDLNYNAAGGFSYDELKRMNLIPEGSQVFYHSTDELTGLLDGARFRCSNVQTGRRPGGRRSLPDILFEGQIIAFSAFDERKLSNGFVQVISKVH